jgi:SPP1 family predicted phage head-tail adaptor
MAAGAYNTRVRIEQPADATDDIGGPDLTWTKYADRWASVAPSNGREYQQALAVVVDLAAVLRLRYDSLTRSITPRMRIVKGDRLWHIASVANDGERNKEMVLYCTEVVA